MARHSKKEAMHAISSMGWSMSFVSLLGLAVISVLFGARSTEAQCAEGTFDATCVCIDDADDGCRLSGYQRQSCACQTGINVKLKRNDTTGVWEVDGTYQVNRSTYLSGIEITSMDTFLESLKGMMSHPIVLKSTSVESFQLPEDALRIGGLAIVGNKYFTSLSGTGDLEHVKGDLDISGNEALVNITGFDNLTMVDGRLLIGNNEALMSISGFQNLVVVDGSFGIENNLALLSISDFNGLTKVTYNFSVRGSAGIKDISGFNMLESVDGDLYITAHKSLVSISGLESLRSVRGIVSLQSNHILKDIHGFRALVKVGGLQIQKNGEVFDCNSGDKLSGPAHISGLSSLTQVDGDVDISDNNAIANISGLQNLSRVKGNLQIKSNVKLTTVVGFGRLETVDGDLVINSNAVFDDGSGMSGLRSVNGSVIITGNENLWSISWFENLTIVTGSFAVRHGVQHLDTTGLKSLKMVGKDFHIVLDSGCQHGCSKSLEGFDTLEEVGGNVNISCSCLNGTELKGLQKIGGDFIIEKNELVDDGNAYFQNVTNVDGSLIVAFNNVTSGTRDCSEFNILEALKQVCLGKRDTSCGLRIHGNSWYQQISSFGNLSKIGGSLEISNNGDLCTIQKFSRLEFIGPSRRASGTPADLFNVSVGFFIAHNPKLARVEGFEALSKIGGYLAIVDNARLSHIYLPALESVTSRTIIQSNMDGSPTWSSGPLPFREGGCNSWDDRVPHVDTMSDGGQVFVTRLRSMACTEKLLSSLSSLGVVIVMVLAFLILLFYVARDFYNPYQERVSVDTLRDTFATHLVAVADLLSDMYFIVSVFLLNGDNTSGIVIGVLSVMVVFTSMWYKVIATYVGLTSKKIAEDLELPLIDGSGMLLQCLNESKMMRKSDWLVLFPGLLVLDVEVLKHMPWAPLTSGTNEHSYAGFPHKYFSNVAFRAALLEDVPQILLQIAFIVTVQNSEGTDINGAIASLTLSIIDIMVKFVFPVFLLWFFPPRHLRRVKAREVR
eukprot:evm.model.scf_88.1 EVM.evm.TU.scf_88.1   scf_88:35776-38799(+)